MGAERVDLDRYADEFRYRLERAEPGSALKECARWGLNLVAELRATRRAQERLAKIRLLLETSPFGPTLADLRRLVFEIRQVAFADEQPTSNTDSEHGL
jgi:hypothetical protein